MTRRAQSWMHQILMPESRRAGAGGGTRFQVDHVAREPVQVLRMRGQRCSRRLLVYLQPVKRQQVVLAAR